MHGDKGVRDVISMIRLLALVKRSARNIATQETDSVVDHGLFICPNMRRHQEAKRRLISSGPIIKWRESH